jgi:TetR/AcrR family transcriptional regulator, transcriptional repressor for nem operon
MESTRQHIVDTAFKLFLQNSYKAVTLQQILQNSGLSKGAFYHYFTSKEAIFQEIIEQTLLPINTVNYELLSHNSLKQFIESYLSQFQQEKFSQVPAPNSVGGNFNFHALIFEALRIMPGFREKFGRLQETELQAWKKIVRIAKKTGEVQFEQGTTEIARLFIFCIDGAGMNQLIRDKATSLKKEIANTLWTLYNTLSK